MRDQVQPEHNQQLLQMDKELEKTKDRVSKMREGKLKEMLIKEIKEKEKKQTILK